MDIVELALDQREDRPGHGAAEWIITFLNNESKSGTIGILGDGCYALTHGQRTYFFQADKVVYMYQKR